PADVRRWMEVFGERIGLVNLYGPTETTVTKLYHFVQAEDRERTSIPIGKPMPGAAAMVVNSADLPCPAGVAGEIYIRTPYRSLGYHGEPKLTREAFIQNPFSQDPNDIVYKTGDYGRLLKDGSLEFLGRRDHQVKIRGVRVELGEVENQLRQHPAVKDVAVVDREDGAGNKYLCAYVVMAEGQGTSQLREHLSSHLPEFMVPSAYMAMQELPRTLNGKIDRKSLPSLEETHREKKNENRARTAVEEIIAGIWGQVLHLPHVGVEESFFELGGHSLLATQIISRIRESLHVDLPLRALFEDPTVAALAGRVEREIKAGASAEIMPIVTVPRNGALPLSHAQQRLWILEQLDPENAAYNIPVVLKMSGQLNIPALEQGLSEVLRRHEVLRTSFPSNDGQPHLVIKPAAAWQVPVMDLSGMETAEQDMEARRIATYAASQTFDLGRGPLVRCILLRLGDHEHVVVCVMHHIVYDGWSREIFVREISVSYEAFAGGQPSLLPEVPIQYVDFAVWQRQWLQGSVLESELVYWKRKLAQAPPLLQLPASRTRPAVQSYRGGRELLQLSQKASEELNALSRRSGVTLFMTLLAAFKLLLHRWTAQDDIVVGTSVAGRTRPDIERLIGFFVNMLVLRTDCSGDPTFLELLARTRDVTLEAFAHQEMPFEMLVDQLQPRRNLGYPPLFQVMFSLQNAPASELALPSLTLSFLPMEETTAKYDLLLDMWEGPQGLSGALDYNADIFDSSAVKLMVRQYQGLLEQLLLAPQQHLSLIPLLSELEKEQLVVEWNRSESEYPSHLCMHELFEAQAQKSPEDTALIFEAGRMSYGELNRKANRVARYLQSLGAGPGKLVGLCFEHSLDEVVALLGVLKAGSGYVPLDPQYPRQRLEFMLTDAQVSVVLTTEKLAANLPPGQEQIVCLDSDWPFIAQQLDTNLKNPGGPQDLAYVIYTSGSTGEPKGVAITHQSLVNYIWWAQTVYLQNERHGFALYSSLSFDLTVTSIYTALITGNLLIIFRPEGKEPPLAEILEDGRVDVLKLTPSHLLLIKDRDNRGSRIKRLIVGGEALTTKIAREIWQSFGGEVQIYNEYGPTEATVGCMIHKFDPGNDGAFVPIGRPAANAQIYVLDRWLNPVAQNMIGELYIAGHGLAQGYLNRPQLTNERFVSNPFIPGQRMYKTGDLAKWLPDGVLDYLGRADDQVKLHGFRVELGEIEAVLGRHSDLRESAVVLREDTPGDKRLVAYIVPSGETVPQIAELRRFMQQELPMFMTPSIFVELPSLPTTTNGKVDRRALPMPGTDRPQVEAVYVEPQTMTERAIASIWQKVLQIEKTGIYDDFFQLGGQSILAIQIIQRINQTFQVNIPMRAMFEEPTIIGLALLVEETIIGKLESESEPELEARSRT
ncbi:MAG TPA: amino acid adenylation domain-containing protein, partial [Candidatus Angelobacter sp.]